MFRLLNKKLTSKKINPPQIAIKIAVWYSIIPNNLALNL